MSSPTDDPAPRPRRRPALTPEQVRDLRRLRSLPTATRPRLADLTARYGVDERTVYKAVRGLPPYDDAAVYGNPRPPRERARDERYEREQAGLRVPLAQAASNKAKHAPVVHSTPWRIVRGSRGRWARG